MKKVLKKIPSHFKKKFTKNPLPKKRMGLKKIMNKKNKEKRELKKNKK